MSEKDSLYENRTSYIRMKDGVVDEFKKNDIKVLLEKTLLDEKCYSRLINNRTCEQSHVKNVKMYMQDMFTELKEKSRSKLQSCCYCCCWLLLLLLLLLVVLLAMLLAMERMVLLLLLLLLVVLLAMLLAISSPAKAGGISRRLIIMII